MKHSLSVIHPDAQIGNNVHIEPFVTIHKDVVIGDNTWIGSNVVIHDGARIGEHCRIFPGAVISTIPQDLKFHDEYSTVEIGNYVTIREYVTVNRGTEHRRTTKIGDFSMIMAYAHVAHDCILGNHIIVANAVNMGGHVVIDDWAIIGGMCAIHQFTKIGKHSIISGGSLVRKDIPPFIKAGREPIAFEGLNIIGLKRRNFTNESIRELQEIYKV